MSQRQKNNRLLARLADQKLPRITDRCCVTGTDALQNLLVLSVWHVSNKVHNKKLNGPFLCHRVSILSAQNTATIEHCRMSISNLQCFTQSLQHDIQGATKMTKLQI